MIRTLLFKLFDAMRFSSRRGSSHMYIIIWVGGIASIGSIPWKERSLNQRILDLIHIVAMTD
jgi:hypothetical protein